MGTYDGKKGLIFGVRDEASLAWAIAKALHAEGAEVGFNYLRQKESVETLAGSIGSNFVEKCDAADDDSIDAFFTKVSKHFGSIHFLVHSIAYCPPEELRGRFSDTSRNGFRIALDVSCYSLIALVKRSRELMPEGGSIIALTYYGSEKVIPSYGVMGIAKAALEASVRYLAYDLGKQKIRVNGISAGSVKTQATARLPGIDAWLDYLDLASPAGLISQTDVGNTAVFLLGDRAAHITGEVLHVDGGYNIIGAPILESLSGMDR